MNKSLRVAEHGRIDRRPTLGGIEETFQRCKMRRRRRARQADEQGGRRERGRDGVGVLDRAAVLVRLLFREREHPATGSATLKKVGERDARFVRKGRGDDADSPHRVLERRVRDGWKKARRLVVHGGDQVLARWTGGSQTGRRDLQTLGDDGRSRWVAVVWVQGRLMPEDRGETHE